jgi:hypothetical protein
MKVQSTGLGKTVMIANFKGLEIAEFDNEKVMQMRMESTEPLHWTIRVFMEPTDVRKAVFMGLKPSIVWKGLLGLLLGRFSLFPKAGAETDTADASPKESELPKAPPAPIAAPTNNGQTTSPLAKLKG